MKTTAILLLVWAAFVGHSEGNASAAKQKVKMHVQYSDNLVNVGNLDIFAASWQKIYATRGNGKGAVNDDTYKTYSSTCESAERPTLDLNVRVEMTGSWGANAKSGINMYQMRDAIVQTAWATYNQLAIAKRYDVYSDCRGYTWQESVSYTSSAACGPRSKVACPKSCKSAMLQCMGHSYGLYLPSTLHVSAYLGDQLLPDSITFNINAASLHTNNGCGIWGIVAENLAGFIPVVGSLFATGIQIECS